MLTYSPPLVSILMTSYNHAKFIGYTLDSLEKQIYDNIEIIIVDDYSTDNSSEIINNSIPKLKQRFKRVEFIEKKENKGVADSLNVGVGKSEGEFVYLIASDDLAEPEAIMTLVEFAVSNPEYGLVVGNDIIIDDNNERIYWKENREIVYDENLAVYKTGADFHEVMRKDEHTNTSEYFGSYESYLKRCPLNHGILIKKSLIDDVGGYMDSVNEDWYMCLRLSRITKFKYIDKILSSYRWHTSNTVKQPNVINLPTTKTIINELKLLFENNEYEKYRKSIRVGFRIPLSLIVPSNDTNTMNFIISELNKIKINSISNFFQITLLIFHLKCDISWLYRKKVNELLAMQNFTLETLECSFMALKYNSLSLKSIFLLLQCTILFLKNNIKN